MTTHRPSPSITPTRPALSLLAAFLYAALPFYALAEGGTIPYTELSRRHSVDATGREVIAIQVRPPAFEPPPPAPTSVQPPMPSITWAAKQAELRQAAKRHEIFSVTAHVRTIPGLGVVSEVRWRAADRDWLAYSNVDFRHLTQLRQIETDDTVYHWQPFVFAADPDEFSSPPGLVFSGPEAEYVVFATRSDWKAAPAAFAALDELHSLYERRRAELSAAHLAREAEAARVAALPPAPPKPVIIRYHVPVLPPPLPATRTSEGGAR